MLQSPLALEPHSSLAWGRIGRPHGPSFGPPHTSTPTFHEGIIATHAIARGSTPPSLSLSLSLFPRRSCWLLTPGPRSNSSPFYLKFIHPGAPPLELPLNAPRGPRAPEPTSSLPWTSPRAPLGPLSRVSWRVRHPRSVLPASPRFQTSIGPSTP